MKNILLIRIPPPVSRVRADTAVQWGEFSGRGELAGELHITEFGQLREAWLSLKEQDPEELAKDEALLEEVLPDQVVLLVPGSLAVHKALPVNSGQRKHLATALPYMMEEELAEDIESMHLASQLIRKDDQVLVSAIPHELMQSLLASLDEQNLSPHHVLAETQFLQTAPQQLSLILESTSVLLSSPQASTVSLDYEALRFVLAQWNETDVDNSLLQTDQDVADEANQVTSVKLLIADGSLPVPDEMKEKVQGWLDEQGWLTEEEHLPGSVFEYLASLYFGSRRSGQLVDLRSGSYQCPKRAGRKLRRWKPLALVASIWLLLELGLMVGEGVVFQQKALDYWQQSAELYLEVFPKDQQVLEAQANGQSSINVKSRMESRLKSAGKRSTGGEPFLPMLQQVSAVSASLKDVKFKPVSMDFNETSGKLVLELKADNLEGVDKLLAAVKSSGLSARLDSANQEKIGVNARMTIGR